MKNKDQIILEDLYEKGVAKQKRYIHIDLYDHIPTLISQKEFEKAKQRMQGSSKKNGVTLYSSDEEMLLVVD